MATTKWLVDWRSPMDQWGAGEPQRPCHRPFRFPFFLLFNVFFSYFSFPFPTAVPSLLRSRSVSLFRFFFLLNLLLRRLRFARTCFFLLDSSLCVFFCFFIGFFLLSVYRAPSFSASKFHRVLLLFCFFGGFLWFRSAVRFFLDSFCFVFSLENLF